MPQFYKRKKENDAVPYDVIERAVAEFTESGGLRKVSAKYAIPKSTLARYVKNNYNIKQKTRTDKFGSAFNTKQIFTINEEKMLVKYIIKSAQLCYGLTKVGIRELAYSFATANGKTVPESWITHERAGEGWIQGFMHRHSELSVRKPEATSLSRCTSFNKTNINEFFSNLKCVMTRFNFNPHSIYNCDETALTTVQKPRKIVAPKGTKQINRVTSSERGTLVTTLCTINASGNSLPPFYVFPRKYFKDHMLRGAPPGSAGASYSSGWMTGTNFLLYLKHFLTFTKPTAETPILLIFDNHESHITIESLNYCKNNYIILLTFPPHCTDRLQPLDVSVFAALKNYYDQALDSWMTLNPGKTVTIYDVAELSCQPIVKALTPQNILSGFRKTGIFPYNPDVFTEADFLRSYTTDRPDPTTENVDSHQSCRPNSVNSITNEEVNFEAGSSKDHQTVSSPISNCSVSLNRIVSPEEVKPYPKAAARKRKGGRRLVKTQILTDTPTKNAVIADLTARKEKSNKNEKKKPVTKAKRRLIDDSEGESEEDQIVYSDESNNLIFSEDENDGLKINKDERNFEENDFVLVLFSTKTKLIYYVGQIISKSVIFYKVKFLRRKRQSFYFSFPDIDDISEVTDNELVSKLIPSSDKCGTERTGHIYQFNYPELFATNDVR